MQKKDLNKVRKGEEEKTFRAMAELVSPWEDEAGIPTPRDYGFNELLSVYGGGNLANVWVFRAVRAISEAQAQLDLLLQARTKKGRWETIDSGPVPKMFKDINPMMSYYDFTEAESIYMELTGNCFLAFENISPVTGKPREIWPLRPDLIKIHPDKETGEVLGYTFHLGEGKKPILYTRDEMIHRRYFNPMNWFWGASPLAAFRTGLTFEYYTKVYENNFFKHGVRQSGILVTGGKLTEVQWNRLQKQVDSRYGGLERMNRPMLLEGGLDWINVSVPPKDMEYISLKKWNKTEVAAIYNIPPLKLMDMEAASKLANAEIQERLFWSDCIIPRLKKRESFYEEWLLPFFFNKKELSLYRFKHDLSEVRSLQIDEKARAFIAKELTSGDNPIFSVDEVRDSFYSFPPADWGGKQPLVSSSLVPAEFLQSGGAAAAQVLSSERFFDLIADRILERMENRDKRMVEGEVLLKDEAPKQRDEVDKYSEEYIWSIEPEFNVSSEQQQYWREWASKRLKEEDRFVRALNIEYRRELNETLRNLEKLEGGQIIPAHSLLFDEHKAISNMTDVYNNQFGFVMRNSSKEEMERWGLTNPLEVNSPTVIEYGNNQASWFAGIGRDKVAPGQYPGVTGTQLNKLEKELNAGLHLGESIDELTERVGRAFAGTLRADGWAARRIARTETVRIANFSRITQYQRNKDIVESKQWLAQLDAAVEEICASLHGEVAPLDRSFSGGYEQPPDPHVGCRCVVVPVLTEKEARREEELVAEENPMSSVGSLSRCVVIGKFSLGFIFKVPLACSDYVKEGDTWKLGGEAVSGGALERLNKFKIPPAWKQLVASTDVAAKVQVIGLDSVGRWQYIYSEAHVAKAAREKFDRVKLFRKDLGKIREGIKEGVMKNDSRALLLKLEDKTAIRAGSLADTKAKVKAYGLTTLQNEHVFIEGNKVTLKFIAKKGILAEYKIEDETLALWLKSRKTATQVGERLVPEVSAGKLNAYLKKIAGRKSFSIKDFRTYYGTRIAYKELKQYAGKALGEKEKKEVVKNVLAKVSHFLKNTPSMAKKAYIDPVVWDIIGGI